MSEHYRYLISRGRPGSVPQWFHLREQPAVEHLFFWDAFWELSSTRQNGMGFGPIPYTALVMYADRHDLVGEAFETFRRIMRSMDRVFLKLAGQRPVVDEKE